MERRGGPGGREPRGGPWPRAHPRPSGRASRPPLATAGPRGSVQPAPLPRLGGPPGDDGPLVLLRVARLADEGAGDGEAVRAPGLGPPAAGPPRRRRAGVARPGRRPRPEVVAAAPGASDRGPGRAPFPAAPPAPAPLPTPLGRQARPPPPEEGRPVQGRRRRRQGPRRVIDGPLHGGPRPHARRAGRPPDGREVPAGEGAPRHVRGQGGGPQRRGSRSPTVGLRLRLPPGLLTLRTGAPGAPEGPPWGPGSGDGPPRGQVRVHAPLLTRNQGRPVVGRRAGPVTVPDTQTVGPVDGEVSPAHVLVIGPLEATRKDVGVVVAHRGPPEVLGLLHSWGRLTTTEE